MKPNRRRSIKRAELPCVSTPLDPKNELRKDNASTDMSHFDTFSPELRAALRDHTDGQHTQEVVMALHLGMSEEEIIAKITKGVYK